MGEPSPRRVPAVRTRRHRWRRSRPVPSRVPRGAPLHRQSCAGRVHDNCAAAERRDPVFGQERQTIFGHWRMQADHVRRGQRGVKRGASKGRMDQPIRGRHGIMACDPCAQIDAHASIGCADRAQSDDSHARARNLFAKKPRPATTTHSFVCGYDLPKSGQGQTEREFRNAACVGTFGADNRICRRSRAARGKLSTPVPFSADDAKPIGGRDDCL